MIWCAQGALFRPLFCTALKSLTNYSAVTKSVIRNISYTYTSTTITVLIGCYGFFFYPSPKWSKSCARTMPFEFSEKFKFWPNSKTNVVPPCGIVQMSFQIFERAFLPLCWNPHQNWPTTHGENIAVWMPKPPSSRCRAWQTTKTPNFSFSRRRAASDLHQTLYEDSGCPYHFCNSLDFFESGQ